MSDAPAGLPPPYQHLKTVSRSAIGQTWIVRDTRHPKDSFRIIQKLDISSNEPSLVEFGQILLSHKAQTLQTLFKETASSHKIYGYFSEEQSFYVVQPMIKGKSLHRLRDLDQWSIVSVLTDILLMLQQVYSWGLGSCCLHPNDLIQCQSDKGWVWTGTGIFKTIVHQVSKQTLPLTELFPKDTAAYFAPEFLQGRFDMGSDLYTVGVSLIQALTQLPLKELVYGDSGYFVIRRSWYRQKQLPDVLVELLTRMVNPNPLKRYSTITAVLNELDKLPAS
ncbi:MAG: hypothetical protein AAGI69_23910 [Cyanobacteria bacterium P01_H01_bin.21]